MLRPQLEHVIRAASGITGATEIVIVGSQSVLGQFPDAPDDRCIYIPQSRGCRSHRGFNRRRFAISANVWLLRPRCRRRNGGASQELEKPIDSGRNENTGNGCGLYLEIHDLAVAKLVAGREKDCEFIRQLLHHDLAKLPIIEGRLRETPLPNETFESALARLRRLASS